MKAPWSRGSPPARLQRLADEELMGLVAGADADAFQTILERHGNVAYALARRICGTHAAAEEVTQEAFLLLWRSAGRYDSSRASVRTWTLSIVRNRAIDLLRMQSRRPAEELAGDAHGALERIAGAADTHRQAIANVEGGRMRDALGELPSEQRQTIELAYFAGFTQSEIASMLHEPLGTIKGRMRLGLHKLRDSTQPARAPSP